MSRLIVVKPYPIAAIAASRGAGAANLLTPDPKEVWLDTADAGTATISIDLGAVQPVDTLFLGFGNASDDALLSITYGVAGYADATFLVERAMIAPTRAPYGRRHAPVWRAPVAARYLRVAITDPAAPAIQLGIVAAGLAFQPAFSHELGSGRTIGDTGTRERLLSGGFGVDHGAATTGWQWTLGDLLDEELDALYALVRDRRTTRSVLVVEDPDNTTGLSERSHWGMFDRLEPWERRAPGKTRWNFRIEDWA